MTDHASERRPDQFRVRGTESSDGEVLYLFCPQEECNWFAVTGESIPLGRLLEVSADHLAGPVVDTDDDAVWIMGVPE